MRLFDFSLKLNGFEIDKAKKVLADIQGKTESDFKDYIEEQKKLILQHHLNYNPFYKTFGKAIDIENWNSIPIMTKRHLQQPIEKRLSQGYSTNNVYINKTSGSSGDPFIFAKDKWCHAMTWAQIMDRFSWYNIDFNSSKQARFYGIPLDRKGYTKERIKDLFSNRYRFSVFNLSDDAFDKVLYKFKAISFEFINGYTSPIVQFAKFLKRKNIVLKEICPSLKVCIVTSEMLFDLDRKLIKSQFGVPIVNEYGASELDLIAFETPNGDWRVNSDTLYIEIIDEKDKVLPYGEEGRVIITSLYNKAHPFIRYDIGDIGSLTLDSSERLPKLNSLLGRTNDIVILPSGKKAAGLTFYYITKSVIENDSNISEFVIEQATLDQFIITYASKTPLTDQKKSVITKEIEKYLEPNLSITFKRVDVLKRTKAGKLKQFISSL
ncbi:phenylacetate--CoA ligase family protein [Winogradskyella alexanderae]|uniref:Phenylacetate--CoA ligase family protein n=1 Tax=Winogradskyella alexanderae TaxID=2877123 RepID=A0ABS7XMS1_9FLAO|nr:phenylacetate--CoA ligase family protein [Winogradskyella alexanderae]MCA0131307.1 phenylacetate--CoA ligase family protein [Winogradskyella alexanderae]